MPGLPVLSSVSVSLSQVFRVFRGTHFEKGMVPALLRAMATVQATRRGQQHRAWTVVLVALVLWGLPLEARPDSLPGPLRQWMHYEQRLLSRSVDTTRLKALDNHQDRQFSPEAGKTFPVKSYWVDAGRVDAFQGQGLPRDLKQLFTRTQGGKKQVRLLVHPESEVFYKGFLRGAARGSDFLASATASSRTMLVWKKGHAAQPFFAKVSLDKKIGGVVRTVPKGEVARSVGVNNVLQADRRGLPRSMGFLPEVFGVMPKGMERGGMIIRAIPKEITSGQIRVVPLFSLYAKRPGGKPPLLVEMIRNSGMTAEAFVRERIVRPFARQWLELAIKRGITMEPHAQNVLLEVGRDGLPSGRFYHRDFGGFNVDLAYRQQRGLPSPRELPTVTSVKKDYFTGLHGKSLAGLTPYFVGGFLYNIDRQLPRWQKAGLLGKERGKGSRAPSFKKVLVQELRSEYRAITGRGPGLMFGLWRVPAKVHAARKALLSRAHPGRPGRLRRLVGGIPRLLRRLARKPGRPTR